MTAASAHGHRSLDFVDCVVAGVLVSRFIKPLLKKLKAHVHPLMLYFFFLGTHPYDSRLTAVLVVGDDEERVVPHGACPQRLVDGLHQRLAQAHIVVGMLVV